MHDSGHGAFGDYQRKFHLALDGEIKQMRKQGGQTTSITDGRRLGIRNGKHLYTFNLDSEIKLPDDTPVDIIYQQARYPGILITSEGFDLLLAIDRNIGDTVAQARITTEPWFLLEKLQERLNSATSADEANRILALSLLRGERDVLSQAHRRTKPNTSIIHGHLGLSTDINQHQRSAIEAIMSQSVSFVWGPPGTGKTSTLGLAIAGLVNEGESVLLLAHSNTAVDTAMLSLAKHLQASSYYNEGLVIRFGFGSGDTYQQYPLINVRGIARKQHPQLASSIENLEKEKSKLVRRSRDADLSARQKQVIQNRVAEIRELLSPLKLEIRMIESDLVRSAVVVGCTLSKSTIAEEIYARNFDAVVIDEASMAYIPHCAYAATLASKRIAIFGDSRQLGPICQSDEALVARWLNRDIFEEAGVARVSGQNEVDDRISLLKMQYRMHPSISSICNNLFYSNLLQDGEGVERRAATVMNSIPYPGHPLVFVDLSSDITACYKEIETHSRFNPVSALVSVCIAFSAANSGVKSIGIITPYKAQARLIHRILRDCRIDFVQASTVHRFQGSEKELIIFDAVESNPQKSIGRPMQGGLKSTAARLLNVAASRAHSKFVLLMNQEYVRSELDHFSILRKFADRVYRNSLKVDITRANLFSDGLQGLNNVQYYPSILASSDFINADLASARHTLYLDFPSNFDCFELIAAQCIGQSVSIVARGSRRLIDHFGKRQMNHKAVKSFSPDALMGIDNKILWIIRCDKKPFSALRIALPGTSGLLHTFMQFNQEVAIAEEIEQGHSPFGACELCQKPLWPQPSLHRNGEPSISCVNHPRQGRRISPKDATAYARLTNQICPECGSALVGGLSTKNGKVYMRCSDRGCSGRLNLSQLI